MTISRALQVAIAAAACVVLLAGCAPGEKPMAETTTSPTPSVTPTASATAAPEPEPEGPAFVAPTDCAALIGQTLAAEFAAKNIVLFDSTAGGGLYTDAGGHGPLQTGGDPFYCLYGQDMVDLSSFQLEVQPLTESEHEGVIAVLDTAGLVKTVDGDAVTFTQVGDDRGTPTLIQVLRPNSWMTAWSAFGGDKQVTLLSGYLTQMAAQTYVG